MKRYRRPAAGVAIDFAGVRSLDALEATVRYLCCDVVGGGRGTHALVHEFVSDR